METGEMIIRGVSDQQIAKFVERQKADDPSNFEILGVTIDVEGAILDCQSTPTSGTKEIRIHQGRYISNSDVDNQVYSLHLWWFNKYGLMAITLTIDQVNMAAITGSDGPH